MSRRITGLCMAAVLLAAFRAHGAEIGHFNGGVMNMRDYLVPDAGVYAALYNFAYMTNRLNDSDGDKVTSVVVDPRGGGVGTPVNVKVNVKMYVLVPTLVWTTDVESLGIKYGALVSPTFANANLNALATVASGRGGDISAGGSGVGDLFVQPVWLGKTLEHWDFAFAYGFYAPVGKYDTDIATVPGVGPVKTESTDNIGYGFWTNQLQGSGAWYPMDNKGTAVIAALTYEINAKKQGFDLTPGQNLTLNWGFSQFLPLRNDMSVMLDFGPAGYDTWQVTDDSGSAATSTRDQVHAVGGQLGLTYVPWMASLTVHGFHEYASEDRFQGNSFGLNFGKKF